MVELRGEERQFQIERTAGAQSLKVVLNLAVGPLGCREGKWISMKLEG